MVDSSKKEGCYTRQYDSIGNLVSEQAGQNYVVTHSYKNKLRAKSIHVRYREDDDAQTDTTYFNYDKLDRLSSKIFNHYRYQQAGQHSGYQRDWTVITTNDYLNDTTVLSKEENFDFHRNTLTAQRVSYDTLIYDRDGSLLCKIHQRSKKKTFYVYNSRKQIVSRTTTTGSNPTSIVTKETFTYKEGHLIREEVLLHTTDNSSADSHVFEYFNNKNGLVEEYRLGPNNSMIYRYEYY